MVVPHVRTLSTVLLVCIQKCMYKLSFLLGTTIFQSFIMEHSIIMESLFVIWLVYFLLVLVSIYVSITVIFSPIKQSSNPARSYDLNLFHWTD